MARISDEERGAITQAAAAARTALPKLQQQRAALDERIASLESVLKADELINGRKAKTDAGDVGGYGEEGRKRARKGQVGKHIDAVLSDGSLLDESTLREKINETFHVTYGRATIYTALTRGFKQHRYDRQGKKWKLGALTALKSA